MRKTFVILALVAAMIVLSAACSGTTNTTTAPAATTTAGSGTTTAATGDAISIENFAFAPETITIPVGSTVTWTNKDSASHQIKGDTFNSPLLATGQTYQFKFDTAGTYNYICSVHPSMKGVVIVK
jgi:plastocyanin